MNISFKDTGREISRERFSIVSVQTRTKIISQTSLYGRGNNKSSFSPPYRQSKPIEPLPSEDEEGLMKNLFGKHLFYIDSKIVGLRPLTTK